MTRLNSKKKQCKKCGAIYLTEGGGCPHCDSKQQDKNALKRHRNRSEKRNNAWKYPVLSFVLVVLSFITGIFELFTLGVFVLIVWMIVILCRNVKKQFTPVWEANEPTSAPVSARLISSTRYSETSASAFDMAARGAVGAMLGDTPGFLAGILTTKQKTKITGCDATFLVDYEDGHRGAETVDVRSARFLTLYELSEKNDE